MMRLFPAAYHPHGMTTDEFVELFTADKPVVFAFHFSPNVAVVNLVATAGSFRGLPPPR